MTSAATFSSALRDLSVVLTTYPEAGRNTMGNTDRYPLGCPCGLRPPATDDLYAWQCWHDHLTEVHPPSEPT